MTFLRAFFSTPRLTSERTHPAARPLETSAANCPSPSSRDGQSVSFCLSFPSLRVPREIRPLACHHLRKLKRRDGCRNAPRARGRRHSVGSPPGVKGVAAGDVTTPVVETATRAGNSTETCKAMQTTLQRDSGRQALLEQILLPATTTRHETEPISKVYRIRRRSAQRCLPNWYRMGQRNARGDAGRAQKVSWAVLRNTPQIFVR